MSQTLYTFNVDHYRQRAEAALQSAAEQAGTQPGGVTADLRSPDGWRWQVLADLTALSQAVVVDYQAAQAEQTRDRWQARLGGPAATGVSAAVGSIVSAAGASIIHTSAVIGSLVVVVGIVAALGGALLSQNNYLRSRNQKLRFLRLLHDIWDFAYLMLATAAAEDVYGQLVALRTEWETAGN